MNDQREEQESIAINEVQLLLAEKRTSLSVMRTGIAVLVLPLSILSFLIATSKYYSLAEILHIFIVLLVMLAILIVFGFYLILHSLVRMRHYDRLIHEIKLNHNVVGKYIS